MASTSSPPAAAPTGAVRWRLPRFARRLLIIEIVLVLALSLGKSAVYAVLDLADMLTRGPLSAQSATLNASQSPRPWFDLAYQLVGIAATLTPAALAVLLLTMTGLPALRMLGLAPLRWRDGITGLVLALGIGLPGLAIYAAGRALGATVEVIPAALGDHWWTIAVLVLQAVKNAVIEEVIAVGYLSIRLEQLGWRPGAIVAVSALLRGSYHLYQGIGAGIANALMGVIFAEFFRRTRRTMPLIIAHTLLDVGAFVGYAVLGSALGL